MAKMMFAMLSLGMMLLAAANDTGCAVNGAKAVDQATDAAIYIWAATKRCGNPKDKAVKCAIDVTSAATAVGNMANIIVAALYSCDVIHAASPDCGMLAGKLTAAVAGFASATSGMVDGCHKIRSWYGHEFGRGEADDLAKIGLERDLDLGKCIIDAKSSLSSIFDTVAALKGAAAGGDQGHNAFATISAFASLGSAVAGAVDDCSVASGASGNQNAQCASVSLAVVNELHSIADIGHSMAAACKASASRLYLVDNKKKKKNNSMSLALAAFLPVAAVFGFVFGKRLGKAAADQTPRTYTKVGQGSGTDMQAMIQGEVA